MLSMGFKLSASLALLAALVIVGQKDEAQAFSFMSCTRDNLIEFLANNLISRSNLLVEYNKAMETALERYNEDLKSGLLDKMDEIERENHYKGLVVVELGNVRKQIESGPVIDLGTTPAQAEEEKKLAANCYDPDAMVKDWNPNDANLDESLKAEFGDRHEELEAKLAALKEQAAKEDEMGFALSPEVRQTLKIQAKEALMDLMSNEVRQIVLAMLTAYATGDAVTPILSVFSDEIRYKVVRYLANALVQIMSSILGRNIEIYSPVVKKDNAGAESAPKPVVPEPEPAAPWV